MMPKYVQQKERGEENSSVKDNYKTNQIRQKQAIETQEKSTAKLWYIGLQNNNQRVTAPNKIPT